MVILIAFWVLWELADQAKLEHFFIYLLYSFFLECGNFGLKEYFFYVLIFSFAILGFYFCSTMFSR